MNTLDVCPFPEVTLKQFGAGDVVSRWDVVDVSTWATAALAARFLDTL